MASYNEPPWLQPTLVKQISFVFPLHGFCTPYEVWYKQWDLKQRCVKRPYPKPPAKRNDRFGGIPNHREPWVRRLQFPPVFRLENPAYFKRIVKRTRKLVWKSLFVNKSR